MGIGTLAIRSIVGPLFIGHGTQVLFGWFDGPGLDATAAGFEQMGMRPGRRHAILGGGAGALGGALLTLGAATPIAGSLLTGVMITAIRKVHAKNGPWATSGGFEYNLVLIGALTAVVDHGPGRPSVDASLLPRWKGPAWAALAVASGIAGSYLADRPPLSEPAPEAAPETREPSAAANRNGARETEQAST